MNNPAALPPDFSTLRWLAAARLEDEDIPLQELSPAQAAHLIHELRVHQIELEMQNDELRRSQALLEESRTEYADLYDFAPVGYLALEPSGKIVEANLTAANLLGMERHKLLNRFFSHFLSDAGRRFFSQLIYNGGAKCGRRGEFHLQDGKGDTRVLLLDILFLRDSKGQQRHLISMTDITELKRTEEELRLHKEDLEKLANQRTREQAKVNEEFQRAKEQAELLDLAHDAILVRDPRGRITYWNQGAAHHYGWSREAAMGQISHKLLQTVFPQPLLEIERHLMEHGFWEGELIHATRQDRQLVMNSRWTVKRDEVGRVAAILEINQDITAQKQIEKEVHRLASFPLLNPNPVLETDENGQILFANAAARHAAENLRLAQGLKAFLPADLKKKFAEVRQGGPQQYSFDLSLKDRIYAAVLFFPQDVSTARLYAMDITEHKRAEEACN